MSKKILVVSDTHGVNFNLQKVLSFFGKKGRDLDLLIHLGDSQMSAEALGGMVDCPVEAVRGNCDSENRFPITKLVSIGRERVMLTHGHRYGCKMGTGLLADLARENGAGTVLFGHTHMPLAENVYGIRVLNPGSLSLPRQEGRCPTYMVLTAEEGKGFDYSILKLEGK